MTAATKKFARGETAAAGAARAGVLDVVLDVLLDAGLDMGSKMHAHGLNNR
jgi:hypothetical protein